MFQQQMEVRSVEAIVRALNEANVQYLVVGGLAVNAHGYVRGTDDLDLVIALDPENAVRGLRALESVGYHPAVPITPEQFADANLRESWIAEKGMALLKLWSDTHGRTDVDVFVSHPFSMKEELKRAEHFELSPGVMMPVVCLPTLREMKMAAGRPQDIADIAALDEIHEKKEHAGDESA